MKVSILVFVELALGHNKLTFSGFAQFSFNPCFRGTCPRTVVFLLATGAIDSFNPCFRGTCPRTVSSDTPWPERCRSFNPCFRGTCPRTVSSDTPWPERCRSFNPCFRGTCPRTLSRKESGATPSRVSILVFVELALGRRGRHARREGVMVSILVFVELALGHFGKTKLK